MQVSAGTDWEESTYTTASVQTDGCKTYIPLGILNQEGKIVSIPLDEMDYLLLIDGTKLYSQP